MRKYKLTIGLHVAFNHFTIWGEENKDDSPQMHRMRNIAEDLEINSYLNRDNIQKEAGGVFPEDFGWNKCEGTKEYFRKLLQKAKEKEDDKNQPSDNTQSSKNNQPSDDKQPSENGQPLNDRQSSDDGQPSEGQMQSLADSLQRFDDHSMWPDDLTESEAEQLEQTVNDMLVMAAEEVEKNQGSVPGCLKMKVEKLRNRKRPRPVADWKRFFRRYLGNEFSEFMRKSKKRESRRFPDAAGNRHRRKSHILVAIDTSGSVSMPEYQEFFGQIRTLKDSASFHVLECDARIKHEYDYNGRPNMTLHGGGGTSFQPPVDYFNENKKRFDALVYFTDGEATIPKDTPKETLWVISSKGNQSDRQRYKVNGASVVFIPKKDR